MKGTSKRGGPRTPGPGKRNGRPRRAIADKTPDARGLVTVRIDPAREMIIPVDLETRALAQRLMLRDWPGVGGVEELYAFAVRKLAETKETDMDMTRIVWAGGATAEEERESTTAQQTEIAAVLAAHPGWRTFDPDDGSGDILCAPAGTQEIGRPI